MRALWTALAVFLPSVSTVVAVGVAADVVLQVLSGVALAFVFSLLTSLADLPEVSGKEYGRWKAVALRVLRTFIQSFLALCVADLAWGNFSWTVIVQAVAATLVTLIRTYLATLPEQVTKPL